MGARFLNRQSRGRRTSGIHIEGEGGEDLAPHNIDEQRFRLAIRMELSDS
jgi:hypothetical protein